MLHALTMMMFIKKTLLHELYLDDMQILKQKLPRDFTGLLYVANKTSHFFFLTKAVKALDILDVMLYCLNGKKVDLADSNWETQIKKI